MHLVGMLVIVKGCSWQMGHAKVKFVVPAVWGAGAASEPCTSVAPAAARVRMHLPRVRCAWAPSEAPTWPAVRVDATMPQLSAARCMGRLCASSILARECGGLTEREAQRSDVEGDAKPPCGRRTFPAAEPVHAQLNMYPYQQQPPPGYYQGGPPPPGAPPPAGYVVAPPPGYPGGPPPPGAPPPAAYGAQPGAPPSYGAPPAAPPAGQPPAGAAAASDPAQVDLWFASIDSDRRCRAGQAWGREPLGGQSGGRRATIARTKPNVALALRAAASWTPRSCSRPWRWATCASASPVKGGSGASRRFAFLARARQPACAACAAQTWTPWCGRSRRATSAS